MAKMSIISLLLILLLLFLFFSSPNFCASSCDFQKESAKIMGEYFALAEKEIIAQNGTAQRNLRDDNAYFLYHPGGWHVEVPKESLRQLIHRVNEINDQVQRHTFAIMDGLIELKHQYFLRISRERSEYENGLKKMRAKGAKNGGKGGEEEDDGGGGAIAEKIGQFRMECHYQFLCLRTEMEVLSSEHNLLQRELLAEIFVLLSDLARQYGKKGIEREFLEQDDNQHTRDGHILVKWVTTPESSAFFLKLYVKEESAKRVESIERIEEMVGQLVADGVRKKDGNGKKRKRKKKMLQNKARLSP